MSERDIFAAALEMTDPAARSVYLDQACAGDGALRQRVEMLLGTHGSAGDFLEQPAVAQMAGDAAPSQDATAALDPAGRPEPASPPTEPGGDEVDEALDFLRPSAKPGSLGRLGHYEVLEVLGRGGFGIVLKAFDEVLHRVVAVKVMAPRLAATSPARKRFLREARAAAAVRHDNVVAIYNVEEQPIPYLVMEFIAGETVQQRLDRTGPLDAAEVARIGRQIADGLAAAHQQGLIHRDVKPANILLERGADRVKISDFGLARAADDASLTQSGFIAGTPMYMAPEQAQGEVIDHRADLFSLGSVLYLMCSGRPPFRASTTMAVLKRVAEDAPRPIREIIPEVPEWLCAIVAKLHAKRPAERFASAKETAEHLERCLAELRERDGVPSPPTLSAAVCPPRPREPAAPASLPPVGGMRRDGKPRRRWLVPAGAAVLIACPLLVVILLVSVLRPPHGDPAADPKGPVEDVWPKQVAALPAGEQAAAVVAKLQELNPGFDGEVTPTVESGVVVGLEFRGFKVKDLSPLRALTGLQSLSCGGWGEVAPVSDLSPLKDLKLIKLVCPYSQVSDLSPLKHMKLTHLDCGFTRVFDLSPLKGMPLKELTCQHTRVADLSPLIGMPLTHLGCNNTKASDLSPLKGMPLILLWCDFTPERDAEMLRSLKTLEQINNTPAAAFWKEVDAKKPAGAP